MKSYQLLGLHFFTEIVELKSLTTNSNVNVLFLRCLFLEVIVTIDKQNRITSGLMMS